LPRSDKSSPGFFFDNSPVVLFVELHTYNTVVLGGDQLLVDATGKSEISVQDYAVAMIDELERPEHVRRRFTVGY
jgi:putative NADH-flavin reductase